MWFAGDSTLDNKYWLYSNGAAQTANPLERRCTATACNGYEELLDTPRMVCDVAYYCNRVVANDDGDSCQGPLVVNTAVEAVGK